MLRKSGEHPHYDVGEGNRELNRRYGDYRRFVVRYVSKNFADVCADDVAQLAMERLFRKRYDQDAHRSMDSLLCTIATNIVHDLRRRQRLAAQVPPGRHGPSPVTSPEEEVIDNENKRLARQAFKLLAPADQKVIQAVDVDGGSCVNLSAAEGISYVAMRKRLSRARGRLVQHFMRLSRVVVPLGAAVEAVRWLRRYAQTALIGATGAATVAAAVSLIPGALGPDSGGTDVVDAIQSPPAVTADASPAPESSSAGHTETSRVARDVPATSKRRGPAAPHSGSDHSVAHLRPGLAVSPGTGPGQKQENEVVAETPLGPVGTGGTSHATGSATVTSMCGRQVPSAVPGCDRSPRMAGADSGRGDPTGLDPLRVTQR